ncbi:CocE/NonD family hydrolase [Actinomadura spongiicola]|nr:CocE/NonD family hydrolase [Actinomadura spongiicola]
MSDRRIETDIAVRAADGVSLVGDLFLPARTPAPVVVLRTPYGAAGAWPQAAALADHGVAAYVQDLRGRHRSGGTFTLGRDEGSDGAATHDWVSTRPWCDGRVLLAGTGYEAFAAWCAANHPAVWAVASRQPWPVLGTPPLDEELWWRTELATGPAVRPGLFELAFALDPGLGADLGDPALPERWPAPVGPWPPEPDAFGTRARDVARRVRATSVPTLHVGSWFCRSAETTLSHAALAADPTVVIGGWASPLTHRLSPECAIAVPDEPDADDLMLSWLATLARGGKWTDARRCLVLGAGWRDRDPCPPARAPYRQEPLAADRTVLVHDPADPFPSLPHSADLAAVADRDDVVRLTAEGPLSWHGSALLAVTVRAERPVELVATLVHERADGVRVRLGDGTAALPGGTGRAELRLPPVAAALPAADRLHVELTAGRVPRRRAPREPARYEIEPRPLRLPQPAAEEA